MRSTWARWAVMGVLLSCEDETVCEKAADRLKYCHAMKRDEGPLLGNSNSSVPVHMGTMLLVAPDDCSGLNECLGTCLAPATCADIEGIESGNSTDPNAPPFAINPELAACVQACWQQ